MKIRSLGYLLLILIIAILLRLFHLGTNSLWLDEIGQVVAASGTWKNLFHIVGIHLSPPLDYMILKLFLLFGHSDWVVRLPAFLFGIASIPTIYFFSLRSTKNENMSIIVSLLLAISPVAIAYSQETRMYSLFLFLSLLSYYFAFRFYEEVSWKRGVLLGVVNGLLVFTHYFGGFVCIGEMIGLLVFWAWKRKPFLYYRILIVCGLITITMFLPWLPSFLAQIHQSGGQIAYALDADKNYLKYILNEFSLHSGGEEGFWYYFYLALFFVGLFFAIIRKNKILIFLAIVFLVCVFGFFGVTAFKKITTTRNLIFLLPLYLILCSAGLTWLYEKIKINLSLYLAILLAILIFPVYQYHFGGRPDFKPDWKNAAEYLKANVPESQKILVTDIYTRGCLNYYLYPKSGYVFMAPKSYEIENAINEKVWIITDDIIAKVNLGQVSAWFVLPPYFFSEKKRDYFLATMSKFLVVPQKSFKTQGKGKPLEIYKIKN